MIPSETPDTQHISIRRVVAADRACNPRMIGSALRRDDREGSDLDLLVDPLPGATLFDRGTIQVELEELLGLPTDVLTPADLPQRFRAQVLREAVAT